MAKLDRSLGLFGLVAVSVGAMLGGEIFVLPAVVSQMTGPSLWLAYVVAAFLVLPAALSKSELATALPASGGSYVFIERCLGPLAGTIGGIGLSVSLILKAAFALMVLGAYLLGAGLWFSRKDDDDLQDGGHWLPSRDERGEGTR